MKRTTKIWGTVLLILIAALGIICLISPASDKQVPFDQRAWMRDIRRYNMSDSLVVKLNREKPSFEETLDMLGNDFNGVHHPGDTSLTYILKSEPLSVAFYSLEIRFNEDGSFRSAGVLYSD